MAEEYILKYQMKEISIKFVDFWKSLDFQDNVFVKALNSKYNVRVLPHDSVERPDLLFYSIFGISHYDYEDCIKIYFTGENDVPDFNECDYALSFHHINFGNRHLRYPLYMTYEINEALNPPKLSDEEALKRGFCTCLMRNYANCENIRIKIIDAVNEYKPVTYGGPFRNNIGANVEIDGKINFISKYKFNLALENTSLPGYVTEKIVEPLAAPTVPIYWGASDISKDFNPEAYVNVSDYQNIDSFIEDLKSIDNNSSRYLSILRAPRLNIEKSIDYDDQLAAFLGEIVENGKIQRPLKAMGHNFYRRNHILRRFGKNPHTINLLGRLFGIR